MPARGAKAGGRGEGGRGMPTRSSRRHQGLPPEEHKDLDTVNREARMARKAARESEAVQESDVAAEDAVEDQPAAEPETQGDLAVPRKEGKAAPKSDAAHSDVQDSAAHPSGDEVPVGDTDVVKSPETIDLVSESSSSDESVVEIKSESAPAKKEPNAQSSDASPSEPRVQGPSRDPTPGATSLNAAQGATSQGSQNSGATVAHAHAQAAEAALVYVRRELTRWTYAKRDPVTPPNVEFAWPTPRPDANAYFESASSTGSYLEWRTSLPSQDEAWISEFRLKRWGFGIAQDLTAIEIPVSMLTPRECVAILQTLLFEAGFEFSNLIPRWSETHASKVTDELIRSVTDELQSFLALELMGWQLVTDGVRSDLVPVKTDPESRSQQGSSQEHRVKEDDMYSEDDLDLLGRQFLDKLRLTGLKPVRSSRGPSESGRLRKRTRPQPLSTPSLSSLPLYVSEDSRQGSATQTSEMKSADSQTREAIDVVPATLPAVVGTSRSSAESATSGTQTSRDSSSSSSMMSLGGGASSHMPYAGPGGLALIAQSGGAAVATGGMMGFHITRTMLPLKVEPKSEVEPNSEDVDMVEPERQGADQSLKSEHSTRASRSSRSRSRRSRQDSSPGYSDNDSRNSDVRSRHQSRKSEGRSHRSSKSRHSAASSRAPSRRSSASSGPAQIELNVMRQQQEWQARMEQAQQEFLARERLDAMERERRREQRDLEARRHVQELTDQLVQAETARLEAERRAQDLEHRRVLESKNSETRTQESEIALMHERQRIERLDSERTERERLERERLEAEYAARWKQREEEASAELARQAAEVQRVVNEEMTALQKRAEAAEADRDRQKEASTNVQRFTATQLRNLRATLAQVQARRGVADPNSATETQTSNSQTPESATSESEIRNVARGFRVEDKPNLSEVARAQLRATLPQATSSAHSADAKRVKEEHGVASASATQTTTTTIKAPVSRAPPAPKPEQSKNADSRRSDDKKKAARKDKDKDKRRDGAPPPDPDPDDDPSDGGSDSDEISDDDWDDDEDVNANQTTMSTTESGTPLLTFRPFISSNPLTEFDPDAELSERVRWWEKFTSMASQGAWTTKMRTQELKLRLPSPARDWLSQLPKHTQRDWKELSTAFRKKYCKGRTSYSERYFTMETKASESPLDFFYRLNTAAGKADINFRKSPKRQEKHVRRFITKLRETRLKTSLQGQRFKTIADLEFALEQNEEVWVRNNPDPVAPKRDFRADNIPQGRFRPLPKRTGRAYVARNDEADEDSENAPDESQDIADDVRVPVRNSDVVRETETPQPAAPALTASQGSDWTQLLTDEVYRVVDNMGWRSPPPRDPRPPPRDPRPNPGFQQPRRDNPNWDKFCEKCLRWGHVEEDCWKDIKCGRCLELGHPTHMCRAQPCENCGKLHLGKLCDDWKILENMKKLARQGALKDMPSNLLDQLLGGGEANSGKPSNQ